MVVEMSVLHHSEESAVVEETVTLGTTLELEVNADDIQKLVEEHNQELTTDEMMNLHCEQQQEAMEGISSEEEEEKREDEFLASNEIKEGTETPHAADSEIRLRIPAITAGGDHRANHTILPFWLDDRPPLLRHVGVTPAASWSV
ncbi:hypothetical protein ANN_09600 [Periplaneta americana]|uniref:Uncharacterized protein n=1 Tax=Periplaneta americana TaxID=6978 RepID=A0ABQ8TMT3_PERAM|nr:hypothetical protein ANN_09600 [Periplaneta americana]